MDQCTLAAVAIAKDEGPFILEWIAFHRLAGVERFYVFDNGSEDDTKAKLLASGRDVVVTDWPIRPGQRYAYEYAIHELRSTAKWFAFLDIDGFLFSEDGQKIANVLESFQNVEGVGINWRVFGSSGHESAPEGLCIECYTRRAPDQFRPIASSSA